MGLDIETKVIDPADETTVVNLKDDFDSAFDEEEEDATPEEEEGTPEESDREEAEAESDKPKPEDKTEADGKKEEEPQGELAELKSKIENLEKSRTDNQAAFTKSQQQNAELKGRLAEREDAAKEEAETIPDDVQEYLENNPEMVKVVDIMVKKGVTEGLKDVPRETDKALDPGLAETIYGFNLLKAGHSDYDNFIGNKSRKIEPNDEFVAFYTKESGRDNLDPENPNQLIDLLTRFKDLKASEKAKQHDDKKKTDTLELETDARAAIDPGQQGKDIKQPEPDEEDFEAAFNEDD